MAIFRGAGGSGDATTDAANQASVASNKAAEAASSATAAAGSATTAATSATASSASATASASSATSAASSATSATSSATAAAASYDDFDDRYLGPKSSNPATDNDGDTLVVGALYFNTTTNIMMTYTGSAWQSIATGGTGLLASNNLSDVQSASTSRTNLGVAIGSDVQAFSSVLAGTTASYTTAEKTKLSGIETAATADQTGAQIKTAYEAETNAFTDAQFTKLAGIEASATADQSAAEIKTAYESNADTNAFTDADHTKLDGIEASATADQTGAQIKTAYEAETNAFTDAQFTKLAGIESSADVTDATNVTAAGALMDSEVTNLAQVKAFDSSDYAAAGSVTGKNKIINGNFLINQREVSGTVTLAHGVYGHDRFKGGSSGATYTFATSANVTTITITAGSLIQVVEGSNLQSGTHVLSWTGTAQGKIGGGSYAASGVTGTATGGSNLSIEFNTGTISKVQLEEGSTATAFDHRLVGHELVLCQRYYSQPVDSGYDFFAGYFVSGNYGPGCFGTWHAQMRAVPTVVVTLGSLNAVGSVSVNYFDEKRFHLNPTANATSNGFWYLAKLTADAEL